ncbi:MAG TPA: phosphate ABC transporter permease PstA [Bellilinea sp.]|nr:phosphate ABC transporter permease PstA [Bellilinea sp.]
MMTAPEPIIDNTPDFDESTEKRNRKGAVARSLFRTALILAVVFLSTLILSIINDSFGKVIVVNKKDPTTLSAEPIDALTADQLAVLIRENLSKNRVSTLERKGLLETQPHEDLYKVVIEEIVKPEIIETFTLVESFTKAAEIEQQQRDEYPKGTVEFRRWLNPNFVKSTMSSRPELAGIRSALLGSLFLILITIAIAFPTGVGAAIFLEEYATSDSIVKRVIQTNIDNLAGVPSIIYGILGLALFVRTLEPLTSGSLFGITGGNGRTVLAAGMTMALLILPILIINAQEAIRAVPSSLRQASYGLGATRWQTIWHHVLPSAMPGILTGTILAISRAIGETAPLILIVPSTFVTSDPKGIFAPFTALPIVIYNWTSRPQPAFQHIAAAGILVLLAALLTMNAFAILLRNKFSKRV